jgi:hypothetical protein
MSEFFKTSVIWVVDFRFDGGRPRRWSRAFGTDDDVRQAMVSQLWALYCHRAQLICVRRAPCDRTRPNARMRGCAVPARRGAEERLVPDPSAYSAGYWLQLQRVKGPRQHRSAHKKR